jgi:glycerol uptake facilitator-like aquaporin
MGIFKQKTKFSRLAAELLGTFFLTKIVLLTLTGNLDVATPIAASLTLMVFVYTVGTMSGAHLNPAITIGLLATKKIKTMEAAWYIVAQVIGACLAMLATFFVFGLPEVSTDGIVWQLILGEFIGTFVLAWGVYSVASGKTTEAASGITIGGSLLLGLMLASPLSNAVLNPAVALGIGSVSLCYILTPIIASLAAMLMYKSLENCKLKV